MKLFITTLTMIFISFGVVAKEKIYECLNAGWNFEVVVQFFLLFFKLLNLFKNN